MRADRPEMELILALLVACLIAITLSTSCAGVVSMPAVESQGARTMVIEDVQAEAYRAVVVVPFTITVQGMRIPLLVTITADIPSGAATCTIETPFTAPVSCDNLMPEPAPDTPAPPDPPDEAI